MIPDWLRHRRPVFLANLTEEVDVGTYMRVTDGKVVMHSDGKDIPISDDLPDEMFEDMLHAQVRMQQLAGIKPAKVLVEANVPNLTTISKEHISKSFMNGPYGPAEFARPCSCNSLKCMYCAPFVKTGGELRGTINRMPSVKDVKELFPDGTAYAHLDDGRVALIIDPDKMDEARWKFDQSWGRYVAHLVQKDRTRTLIERRTLDIIKGYREDSSPKDIAIMKNSLLTFFNRMRMQKDVYQATIDVFADNQVRTRYMETPSVEWIETWFKLEKAPKKSKPILNLTADTELTLKDLAEYEVNANGYRITVKDRFLPLKNPLVSKEILDFVKTPWTVVSPMAMLKEERRKQGVCPECGDKGEWINMAAVCKDHGKFMG